MIEKNLNFFKKPIDKTQIPWYTYKVGAKSADTLETLLELIKKFQKNLKKLLTKGFDGDIIDKLT